MKKVKTNKLGRRILSIVLTVALMVGLMPGNTMTAYAKADGIMYTPKVDMNGTNIYMDGYDTYIVDGTNSGTTAVYYYDNSGNQVYVNPNGAAGDDLSEYKIYSNGETYNALSGDVNIEMTGGSVGSIVIGYYIYGSGNDRTNVNVNISGGSCGCVEKAAHYGNSWVFSEQIVLMNQELTGYVTKTDSGWVAHGDAIIPEGKTVTVGEGEVFQIESGSTLTNNGTIVNNGTINTYALLNGTVTGNGTVVRNAICINDTASSITVYKDGEEYPAQTEVVDGKTYIYVPTGEIKVDMDGEVYYAKYSAEAGEFEPESEPKGVTDFTNMPTEIKANEPFTLSAVKVDEWLNTTVTYAILDDDGTDAVLDGNVLTAYGAGTIQVTVTAMDIYDYTFSKTYEIVVAYTPVSDIEIDENISVPVGDSINLSRYAVTNADASYQTIEWSVVNANGTGATITDNLLTATAAGEATIRATVRNGNAYGEDYTEDFQVGFYAVEGISVNAGSITISKKDDNTITVTGGNVANGSKDYNKNEIIRIYGETTSNTITISEGTTVNLILTDVKIDVSGTEGATPLYVNSNAQLNLTLEGTNVLSSGKFAAALGVPSGAKLVIEESSTGTLEATGYSGGSAGIGGGHGNGSGTITINGGTITAICNSGWGAGIGGGNGGSGGTTTINGGIVIARGHYTGAGIGGGNGGSGGTVTINGGTVTATGYIGIGNGESASGGTLKITGGNINGTYNITPTDGSNEVSCYTCKFIGDSEDMAGKTVTAITLENGGTYGLKDVVTFDGGSENEGYFNCYLPAGSKITSITVGGVTYNCRAEDGTCHVDHDWVDATCQKPEHCSVCELTRGEVIDHDWIDATCQKPEHCSVCELTRGDVGDHNYVDGFCTVCHGYNSDVFVIDSPEDLVAFAENVNAGNKSLSAVLEADIDMKNVAWTPVCQTVSYHETAATDTGYTGIFDGRGHTISNLTVTGISGGTYSYGLFGTVSGTVINLGMVNYTYTMGSATDARAGSIAGQVLTGGTITNCYSVGHSVATSSNIAGGIAGCNYGGTISNCYALNGSVSGHSSGDSIRWGGVVGDCKKDDGAPDQAQTYGTVSYCYTDDTQVASTQNNSANITNCAVKDDTAFASGEVTYLLNGEKTDGTQSWYQTLKTDTYPVPDNTHGTVYYGYTTELPCEVSYTNDKNSLLDQRGEHAWDTDTGVCTKCDAACTHSFDANGECLICGFVLVTDLSVKLTNGGTFAEGEYTFADNIHTINTDKSVTISGTTTSERIFISYGCDANIILAGIDINVSGIGNAYGIGIADNSTGDVTITLKEGTTNKISAGAYGAAVQKNGGYFEGIGLLTIKGDGSLEAKGGTDAAGIGSGAASTSNITITGGNIRAEGKRTAAGIGAGNYNNYCSNITITGGTVTAIGGNDVKRGAGIGAPGLHADDTGFVSNIYISGGSVKAYGLYNGSCDIGFYKVPVTPTVSAGNSASVYRLEIDNPESRDITINGKDYPDFHGDEKKIYVYLPAGTAENPNIVKFSGNTVAAYYYDSEWKTVTCAGGHTASEDDGDCTTDITCVECGYVMSEGADAHTWENGECTNTNCDIVCEHISSTDDGDCTTAVICSVCGKVITEAEAEHIDSNDDGWCDVCDSGVAPELEDGYYQIANAGNLSWFAKFVNNGEKDANAVLLDDIDMTGVAWTPICQTVSYNTTTATDTGYTGTFDGQGHTISNLTVTGISGGTYSYGLFGTVSGTVKKLGMVNYKYILGDASDARAGSIAGQVLTGGTIINCYSVGHTVTTNSKIAGGIAGCNYGGIISNCYALNGSVSGYSDRWGGVVGDCKKDSTAPDLAQTYGTVSNCYTDDERVASSQNNSANIADCAVKDDDAFASGEVAYLLNGSSSENVTWYQKLKTDTYPVLDIDIEHGIVYSVFKCDGEEQVYRNVNENEPHTDEDSNNKCDVCGSDIVVCTEHIPNEDDGDCTTAITCSVCGEVTTAAKAEHTPNEDDGDCTTAITCSECGKVTTAAKATHTPNADDGDCTTAITCSECGTVTTAAKATHTPNADDGDCTTAVTCSVCGTVTTEAKAEHTPNEDDGNCTTAVTCSVCGKVTTEAKPHTDEDSNNKCDVCGSDIVVCTEHIPNADDGDCTTAITCSVCGEVTTEAKATHTPNEDDGDCTTAITCSECGKVTTAAKATHTPNADDGDCTTAITCSECGKVTTAAKATHTPNADDGDCTTAITCSECGTVTTAAKATHTPNADDGDCTTAVTCSVCGTVTTEAKAEHTPNADDGNCTTPVTCSVCGKVTTEAKPHTDENSDNKCDECGSDIVVCTEHIPNEDDGDCTTAITCSVCGEVTTEAKAAHTPNADDGDCTTAITCSVCGTVTTAAKSHTDGNSDDRCDNCGTELDTASDIGTFSGWSVSLDEKIGVNFYMILTDAVKQDDGAYVLFTWGDNESSQVYVSEAGYIEKNNEIWHKFSCDVVAAQMTDEITAKLVTSDMGESSEYTYSVSKYIESKHSDAESSDKLVELLEAMANYGAYAQLYFNYNPNDLANAGMGSELGDVTLSGYDKVINGTLQNGVSYLGSSLLLESEVVIRHYFSITDGAIVAGLNNSLGNSNWSELTSVGNGRYYTEQIVVATELDDAKTLTLGSWSIQYSAMSYAQSMLNGGTTNEKLKNLLKALYYYSEAADAYFGQ